MKNTSNRGSLGLCVYLKVKKSAEYANLRGFIWALFLAGFIFPGCLRDSVYTTYQYAQEPAYAEAAAAANAAAFADEELNAYADEHLPRFDGPRFALSSSSARPGEPVTVAFSNDFSLREYQGLQAVLLDSRFRRVARAAFFSLPEQPEQYLDEVKVAILAIPSTVLRGNALIRIESEEGVIRDFHFTIENRQFHSETIHLNRANTDLRTTPDPRRTQQAQQLWAILSRTGTEIYSAGPFIPPVTSTRRTSLFASRRVFQYVDGGSDVAIHTGVDYGIPTGTEVLASAAGRVVLARYRIITGYSVVLEHLPGIFSLYYHLSSIAVSENSVVEAGDLLGKSGATGLATGPHLHWEIRVSGVYADPYAFLYRPVLDKNDIIDRLKNYQREAVY